MITVRPGTGLDEDAALALWQVDAGRRQRRTGGPRAQRFRQLLRDGGTLLLVAERSGTPVGVLVATLRDDQGAATPGLLHLAALVGEGGAPRALLQALLRRYPRLAAWVEDDEPDLLHALELAGLERTGGERPGAVHLETPAGDGPPP